jgi:predicted nucleic acid-binding protein
MSKIFVLDNSVVMAWCFEDEISKYAESVLGKMPDLQALAPSIWPLELVNVLCAARRKKRLTKTESSRFLHLVKSLPIQVEPLTPEHVFGAIYDLAAGTNLSSYDATYLDLAIREAIPIATLDESLRRAARRHHVPLFKP